MFARFDQLTLTESANSDRVTQLRQRLQEQWREQPGYQGQLTITSGGRHQTIITLWDSPKSIEQWRMHPIFDQFLRESRGQLEDHYVIEGQLESIDLPFLVEPWTAS